MTVELIDGHAGEPHISGDDLGDFKAGILGNEGYVLNRADCLKATLNNANSLSIATGSAIMPGNGRHVRVTEPETLTITSGTAGQYRNDLVVLRADVATSDGTSVETAQLVVIQGTSTSGTPLDPDIGDGDLRLYRIPIEGVNVSDPIALFEVVPTYDEFRASIDQYSTQETTTGKTWIDDSPIYRTVIVANNVTNNQTVPYTFTPRQITSFYVISGNYEVLPLYPGDSYWNVFARCTPNGVNFTIGSSYGVINTATIVCEYTK